MTDWTRVQQYVHSSAFVHDDVLLGHPGDLDNYSTHPFLLGADVCVVDSLEGFGSGTLEHLAELESLPQTIVTPMRKTRSPLSNLMLDSDALDTFCSAFDSKCRGLSFFYGDHPAIPELASVVTERAGSAPLVQPDPTTFRLLNNKIAGREFLETIGVAVPEGAVATSVRELESLGNAFGWPIVCKPEHHFTELVRSAADVSEIRFPVLIERYEPHERSPVSAWFRDADGAIALFTIDQRLHGLEHVGNERVRDLPQSTMRAIDESTLAIAAAVPDVFGAAAVDYVIRTDGSPVAVDLNLRFNSCVYPMYFRSRWPELSRSMMRSGHFDVELPNLDAVSNNSEFPRLRRSQLRRGGAVLIGPVWNPDRMAVQRFFYSIFGEDERSIEHYETLLGRCVAAAR